MKLGVSRTIHKNKSVEEKETFQSSYQPQIVAFAVIPQMGGWTLRMIGL
jgi:hypothetical protein